MKRVLSLLLALCMCCSVFAGCNKKQEEPPMMVVPLPEQQLGGELIPTEATEQTTTPEEFESTSEPAVIEPIPENVLPFEIQKEEITPLPGEYKIADIFDRVWIAVRNADGLTMEACRADDPKSKIVNILDSRTGEYFYSETYTDYDFEGEQRTVFEEKYIILDKPGHYLSYTMNGSHGSVENRSRLVSDGRDYTKADNLMLMLLNFEPFLLSKTVQTIDNQDYYLLSGPCLGDKTWVELYVNTQTFEVNYVKIYSEYKSVESYGQRLDFVIEYAPSEIEPPEWANKADPYPKKDISHEYNGFFNVTMTSPAQLQELYVQADDLAIHIGDSAMQLLSTSFESYEISSMEIFLMTENGAQGREADVNDMLQPKEVALCALKSLEELDVAADWFDKEDYAFAIYNPGDEAIPVKEGIICGITWWGKFIRDASVNDLSYFDYRALFGAPYTSILLDASTNIVFWEKLDYDVWVYQSVMMNIVVLQSKDGPNLLELNLTDMD